MIYVLHGEDDFSKKTFLNALREEIGQLDVRDANTTILEGQDLNLPHLLEVANVVPFLAEHRLVIAAGLLARFEEVRPARRSRAAGGRQNDPFEEWKGLAGSLSELSPTTLLVFLEGRLRRGNPLLSELSDLAEVKEFRILTGDALNRWLASRVNEMGLKITGRASQQLMDLVGGDLWVMQGELEKLALYTDGETIDHEVVQLLVANSREANIFRTVDMVLGGRTSNALRLMKQMQEGGADAGYIIAMLARQLRLMLLAKDLVGQGVPGSEMARRLGLTAEFAVKRTLEQARQHSKEKMVAMYVSLLEADLAIKRGQLSDDLAIETLFVELAQASRSRAEASRTVSR